MVGALLEKMKSQTMNINQICRKLLKSLDSYSDSLKCGSVINDSSLLVPDELNLGKYRSLCPSCKHETMRTPFPPRSLRPVFEMLTECAELNRPILVLILACTAYESMFDGLFYRILERQHVFPVDAIADGMEYRSKIRIFHNLTGKRFESYLDKLGFKKLPTNLMEIRRRRNGFIHTGVAHKEVEVKLDLHSGKQFCFPKRVDLDESDSERALKFTLDTIHCFARLYSDFGKYAEIEPYDY